MLDEVDAAAEERYEAGTAERNGNGTCDGPDAHIVPTNAEDDRSSEE
jgi:hypothetical protein